MRFKNNIKDTGEIGENDIENAGSIEETKIDLTNSKEVSEDYSNSFNKNSNQAFPIGNSLIKSKFRDKTRKSTMVDSPNKMEIESFETKDSGNWRIDLLNTPIMARSGDRIRQDLLSKLTYNKVWVTPSERQSSHQTVFIYDWDDTLL